MKKVIPKVGDRKIDEKGYSRVWTGDRWELESNGQTLKREDFPELYEAISALCGRKEK